MCHLNLLVVNKRQFCRRVLDSVFQYQFRKEIVRKLNTFNIRKIESDITKDDIIYFLIEKGLSQNFFINFIQEVVLHPRSMVYPKFIRRGSPSVPLYQLTRHLWQSYESGCRWKLLFRLWLNIHSFILNILYSLIRLQLFLMIRVFSVGEGGYRN